MIIKLTDEQVVEMAKLAILASKPAGMGFLHFDKDLKKETIIDIEVNHNSLYVDYYQGRMVKFSGRKIGENTWDFNERTSYDYQSWKSKYDSYEILAKEALK